MSRRHRRVSALTSTLLQIECFKYMPPPQLPHFYLSKNFCIKHFKQEDFSIRAFAHFTNGIGALLPQLFTHMACRVQSANQRDRDPSHSPHHPLLYLASGHMGSAVSDPVRGRRPRPSPRTSPMNPLMVENNRRLFSLLLISAEFQSAEPFLSPPELSCPIRIFSRSPKSTASTVNSLIIPCSNLFL